MAILLSIYSENAFREVRLPNINNSDFSFVLYKNIYGIKDDITINMQVLDDNWQFLAGEDYKVYRDFKLHEGVNLLDKDIINIYTKSEMITVVVKHMEKVFFPFGKYDISEQTTIKIGKNETNDISYAYAGLVSREHAVMRKINKKWQIENKSSNGIYVNSSFVQETKTLEFGDFISIIGLHMVFLGDILAIDDETSQVVISEEIKPLSLNDKDNNLIEEKQIKSPNKLYSTKDDGKMLVLRAPRNMQKIYDKPITINGMHGNTISIFGNIFNTRNKKREKAYLKYLVSKEEEIKKYYEENRLAMEKMYISPQECMDCLKDRSLLWTRNTSHSDYMFHRVGTGNIPFQSQIHISDDIMSYDIGAITEKIKKISFSYKELRGVPIGVDLKKHNLIGLVGGKNYEGTEEIVKNLSVQIATNHPYTDVKMIYINNEMSGSVSRKYEFAKWFPHVWSEDKKFRYVARNKSEASDIFYELSKIFRNTEKKVRPHFIMFLNAPQFAEGEIISKYIFEKEKDYGLTTIFMADSIQSLPNACDYVIQNDENFSGIISLGSEGKEKIQVDFDHIDDDEINRFSRIMTNYYVKDVRKGGEVPNEVSFLEMHGITKIEDFKVEDRWRKSKVNENIRGAIGMKAGGEVCYLDLHEKYHGPHGLVAGTTGSGKSETLQSFMLSLAINYSPDDIGFFIIDYKGGGMANQFNKLPHLIGQISNLSENQVRRAMVSIKSENRRRQRLFNKYGVNNINTYIQLYKNKKVPEALPHLLIIVDEFAELKREEPEFLRNLISVAQVGRSLGVHLILSTQKPAGVVDDNIWSNSKFRLCMRVQDKQDSMDIIQKPDASHITQAGRGYLQVGNNEVFELFQSGYSGALYDEYAANRNTKVKIYMINGKEDIDSSLYRNTNIDYSSQTTQLDAITEYLAKVAKKNGYRRRHKLWMPMLKSKIYLDDLEFERTENLKIVFGKYDDPKNQSQNQAWVNFSKRGNLGIYGLASSGKSTGLQTIFYSLMKKYSPKQVWFYGIDFGSKALWVFENAPHCGGIMYDDDLDKINKFFVMIDKICEERKQLLKGASYRQFVKSNSKECLPEIIIAIDNFGAFNQRTNEKYLDGIIALSKEGLNLGIYLIIIGNTIAPTDVPSRLGDNLKQNICYELPDIYDYKKIFHCSKIDVIPETGIKGRGLYAIKDEILECQTALPIKDDDEYKVMELIFEEAQNLKSTYKGKMAREIPVIPNKFTFDEFSEMEDYKKSISEKDKLPAGLNYADVSVFNLNLKETYCYSITGSYRTGKRNFLKVLINAAIDKRAKVALIDNGKKLGTMESNPKLDYIQDEEGVFKYFDDLMPEFVRRNVMKNKLVNKGLEDEEIFKEMSKEVPIFIGISDFAWFVKAIYDSVYDMGECLENIIAKGQYHNIYLIACFGLEDRIEMERYELFNLYVSYRTGIHFGGNILENRFFNFDSVSYNEQNKLQKPGIGFTAGGIDQSSDKILVPLARR